MKTLIQIVIVAMFGIEICSPFFIGYLNHQQKLKKNYSTKEVKNNEAGKKVALVNNNGIKDWESLDFSENNYCDSKTVRVKE